MPISGYILTPTLESFKKQAGRAPLKPLKLSYFELEHAHIYEPRAERSR
jgi:hypothetical protein